MANLYTYVYMGEGVHVYKKYEQQGLCKLKTISEDELTDLFKKAHTSLWSGGQLNPSEEPLTS